MVWGDDLPMPMAFAFSWAPCEAIWAASRVRLGTERVAIVEDCQGMEKWENLWALIRCLL